MEAISMIGKRLVSDKEWEMLQKEVFVYSFIYDH